MSQRLSTAQIKIPSARLSSRQQQREQTQKFVTNNINGIKNIFFEYNIKLKKMTKLFFDII